MSNLTKLEKLELSDLNRYAYTYLAKHLDLTIQDFKKLWITNSFSEKQVARLKELL